MIQIRVVGAKEVQTMLAKLPGNLNKEINQTNGQFMKDVQKSAKLRAPKQTGELAQSIHVEQTGKNEWTLFVDSPYGVFQEEGFKPHWVHAWQSSRNKLGTVGNALQTNPAGYAYVKKYTPFVKPALEHNLSKLAQKLSNAAGEAIKKSR